MSQLGLGLNLSKTKGGVVPFNPLSLDPYLLFDSETSMRGTLEGYTLDLDPATPSSLDVITASRTGVATYTDADGLIQTASPNTTRVDYTQGEQLTPTVYQHFGQTSFDDPAWQKITTSITADDALAPDGTATADRMVIPPTANSQSSRLTEESNITSGTTVTISFYAKADGSINPLVLFANGSVFARILFNLQSETSSFVDGALSITHSIEEAANGFYRCSATFNSAGIGSISIRNATAGDGVSSLLLWGPQLEEGTTASDFVENTTGIPKFITGATYGPRVPMILVEPSATNNLIYSEDFSHAGWTKVNDVVVTPSSVDAPDGTTNAFKLSELQLTDGDYGLSEFLNTTPSTSYTFSAYFKATSDSDVGKKVRIRIRRSVGTSISASESVTLTSEWVRHSVTIDLLSDNTSCWFVVTKDTSSPTAERADECLIWGAQAETGSVMTSYIPTSGSTVTRAADDLVISGSAFDFYNQSEGTIYTEFVPRRVDYYQHLYEFSDGSANNRINVHLESANARFYLTSGGTVYANTIAATNVTTGELHRTGFSYKTNDAPASFDGSAEITDTTVTVPSGIDKVFLGALYTQANDFYLNGHIKRILYWPTHSDSL